MKRRDFHRSLIAATLASRVAELRAEAGPAIRFGACDWTLKLATDPESLTVARRIGLDGVQVDYGTTPGADGSLPLFDPKLQETYLARSAELGVAVPSLAMGVLNKIALKSEPIAERWMLDGVEVARRMKTPVVLLAFFGAGDLRHDEAGVQSVISKLKKLAPVAEEAGVTYGFESWLKAPELERILDAVKSPAIKVYCDVGNMHKEAEDVCAAIRRLGRERICEFHAKDYDDLYGRGSIDFPNVRDAIHDIGYRGWMHIEGVKIPNGVEQDIGFDLAYLRRVFA